MKDIELNSINNIYVCNNNNSICKTKEEHRSQMLLWFDCDQRKLALYCTTTVQHWPVIHLFHVPQEKAEAEQIALSNKEERRM